MSSTPPPRGATTVDDETLAENVAPPDIERSERMQGNTDSTKRYMVRLEHGGWGEFFVHEAERESGAKSYSASWTCNSSYGTYGHYWNSMGAPFADFIRGVDSYYLLGKVAQTRFAPDAFIKAMKRAIFISRATREDKSAAAKALDRIRCEVSDAALVWCCQESREIGVCEIDCCDLPSCESYDGNALDFANKLWPKFVEAVNESALTKAST